MSYRSIHLALTPHPTPTSLGAVEYACAVAQRFGALLNVTSPRLSVHTPTHFLGARMMAGLAAGFEQDAAAKADELEAHVSKKSTELGVTAKIGKVPEQWPSSASDLAWRARTSDLCVMGLNQTGVDARLDVEDWLFGAARPCLLCPNEGAQPFAAETAFVSWDFSKSATRAVFDALPILKIAKSVRVMTVRGEKKIATEDVGSPIREMLQTHGVDAAIDEIDIGKSTIGAAILGQAQSVGASLIIMGAYGHPRLREFVLGGATKEILNTTRIPLLMSH